MTSNPTPCTGVAQYDAGGKGINVSKYLEAMGTETIATGLVGGLFGQFVERQLDRTKIPHDFVEMDGCTRLNTTVLADDGEYKLNQPGHRVNRRTVERVTDKLREYDPDIAVIAGSLPPGLGPATIDRLADAGDWDTVVDVRGGMLRRLKVEYAVAAPNREELGVATGRATDNLESCRLAAESLQGDGIHRVLGSLGPDGAVLATPNGVFSAPATDVEVHRRRRRRPARRRPARTRPRVDGPDRAPVRHGRGLARRRRPRDHRPLARRPGHRPPAGDRP